MGTDKPPTDQHADELARQAASAYSTYIRRIFAATVVMIGPVLLVLLAGLHQAVLPAILLGPIAGWLLRCNTQKYRLRGLLLTKQLVERDHDNERTAEYFPSVQRPYDSVLFEILGAQPIVLRVPPCWHQSLTSDLIFDRLELSGNAFLTGDRAFSPLREDASPSATNLKGQLLSRVFPYNAAGEATRDAVVLPGIAKILDRPSYIESIVEIIAAEDDGMLVSIERDLVEDPLADVGKW